MERLTAANQKQGQHVIPVKLLLPKDGLPTVVHAETLEPIAFAGPVATHVLGIFDPNTGQGHGLMKLENLELVIPELPQETPTT